MAYLTPEARARIEIDRMLAVAGWAVQDAASVNLAQGRGVAGREFVMRAPHGRADYLLFLDGHAAGVIEAKKEGETRTGVEWRPWRSSPRLRRVSLKARSNLRHPADLHVPRPVPVVCYQI